MAGHAGRMWIWALVLLAAGAARGADVAAAGGGETIFEDAGGQASASVTQVLPNAPAAPQQQAFTGVERITLKQEVFVIYWGKGAVTILPRQFVSSITINRRNPVREGPEAEKGTARP